MDCPPTLDSVLRVQSLTDEVAPSERFRLSPATSVAVQWRGSLALRMEPSLQTPDVHHPADHAKGLP